MSTLGKVLVILVALAMLGWILLASLVAEHHANWGQVIKQRKQEIAELEPQLSPLVDKIDRTLAETSLAQVGLDRGRRNFRGAYAMAQRMESDTKETLSRFNYQKDLVDQEVQKAQARASVRLREKQDFLASISREEENVQVLIAENQKLRKQLDDLQKSFLDTMAENQNYLDRLKKAASSSQPRTRLGSFIR